MSGECLNTSSAVPTDPLILVSEMIIKIGLKVTKIFLQVVLCCSASCADVFLVRINQDFAALRS